MTLIHLPVSGSVVCTVNGVVCVFPLDERDASYTTTRNEIVVQKALPSSHVSVNIAATWEHAPTAGEHPVDFVVRSGFGPMAQMKSFPSVVSYVDPSGDTMRITAVGEFTIDLSVQIARVRWMRRLLSVPCCAPASRPPSPVSRAVVLKLPMPHANQGSCMEDMEESLRASFDTVSVSENA